MTYEKDRLEVALHADYNKPTWFPRHGISHLRSGAATDHKWAWPVPGPYHAVWFAKLEPGGFAIPHIDAGKPFYERWHIPITPAGFFWEDGVMYDTPTEPFEVHHWLPHAVGNPTDQPRIHLMVDRLVEPDNAPPESALLITDMIPEIQALIDAIEM